MRFLYLSDFEITATLTSNPEIPRPKFLPCPPPPLLPPSQTGKLGLPSIWQEPPVLVPREVYSSSPFAVSQFSLDSLYLAFVIAHVLILITIHLPMPHIYTLVTDWVCPFCDAISENCPLPDYKKVLLFSGKNLSY